LISFCWFHNSFWVFYKFANSSLVAVFIDSPFIVFSSGPAKSKRGSRKDDDPSGSGPSQPKPKPDDDDTEGEDGGPNHGHGAGSSKVSAVHAKSSLGDEASRVSHYRTTRDSQAQQTLTELEKAESKRLESMRKSRGKSFDLLYFSLCFLRFTSLS
jgi:hypothetical protein